MTEPSLERASDGEDQSPLPPVPDVFSIDLSNAGGLPRSAQRRLWSASLLTAFTAHAVVLGLSWVPSLREAGAGGIELEAIDIDIVSSKVLETRLRAREAASAAQLANVDHTAAGANAASASTDTTDQKPAQAETDAKSAGPIADLVIPEAKEEEPPPEPSDVQLAIADKQPEIPDLDEPEAELETKDDADPETIQPSQASQASEAAEEGGADARGTALMVEPPAQQAAAASPGVANDYAKAIIETLAQRKPRTTAGVRGIVRIGFTVANTGEVREVRVVSSSGRKTLDEAALSAVRSAKFPAPPPALAEANLSYEVPYIFR